MSEDLFGDSGDEELNGEEEIRKEDPPQESKAPKDEPVENGIVTEENGVENEVDGVNGDGEDEIMGDEDDDGEEDKANMHASSPRDDIALTVVQYQKAADDYSFEVLVRRWLMWVGLKLLCTYQLIGPCSSCCFHCSYLYRWSTMERRRQSSGIIRI